MLTEKKQKDLDFIKEKIGQYLPLLLDFLGNDQNLADYSRDLYKHKAEKIHIDRQKDLIKIIKDKLSDIFSEEEISRMDLEFNDGMVSNIVDHHNILNHPILISGLIISSLYYLLHDKTKSLFVLTCGNVPPNNFFHKKGFTFKDKLFPIFTNKDIHKIICGLPYKKLEFLELARERNLMDDLSDKEKKFLEDYQNLLNKASEGKLNNFVDEITKVNYSIFELMFEEGMRKEVPALVNFNTEYLAAKMFCELDKKSFVHKAIFDKDFREAVLKRFDGIWGAWDKQKNLGTHFFWYMLPSGEQAELACDGDYLKTKDEKIDFKVKIEEKELSNLLEKGILVPNLFLSYGIIIFYCGTKPLTGLGSMNYLTDMQNAWTRVLPTRFPEEAELVKKMSMRSLICSPIVTYVRNKKGNIVPEFFADIVFKGGLTKEYLKNLGQMKFGDLMKSSLIENYETKVPQAEKVKLDITVNDLTDESFNWIK